ncbi:acyl transferase/acyl hydrolase/lysophospholipase [Cladorrhinum sp. PSN332]|nr:acyl transferase/acyl hydrolase/lysophospholipase [Cladorrhinum sp. PSN332]
MADQDIDAAQAAAPWGKLNVLTFDGGGVRGYYSLLHLDKLMECIAEAEHRLHEAEPELARAQTPEDLSSFSPHPMPEYVNHPRGNSPGEQPPRHASFLPCHYFDYISGTSTGALITIMLAKFRMSAHDCLGEYERLAGLVFGRPRHVYEMSLQGVMLFSKRHKFSTANLEFAIKDVVKRRGEKPTYRDDAEEMVFGTPRGFCRAIIFITRKIRTADKSKKNKQGPFVSRPYIYRSYDNFRRPRPAGNHPTAAQPRTESDLVREPGQPRRSSTLAVWKLARAATAAKFYFKPLLISLHDSEMLRTTRDEKRMPRTTEIAELVDAGLDDVNNPSQAVHKELKRLLAGSKKIETWVSIGTARGTKPDESRLIKFMAHRIYVAGDTEKVHDHMDEVSESTARENRGPFNYYRLNDTNGLPDVDMDSWIPRGSGPKSGEQTLQDIRRSFENHYRNPEVRDYFRRCAEELVRTRRERTADESLWERYALGTTYTCRLPGCKYEPDQTWEYREQFIAHLQTDHNLTAEQDIKDACKEGSLLWKYKAPANESPIANLSRRRTTWNSIFAG